MKEEPGERPCPICGAEPRPPFRPFCSARCADVDLGRWLSDAYAVPAEPAGDDEEERPPVPGHGRDA